MTNICHISPITHLNGSTTWTANWTFSENPHSSIILTGLRSADAAKATMEYITALFQFQPTSYVIHSS